MASLIDGGDPDHNPLSLDPSVSRWGLGDVAIGFLPTLVTWISLLAAIGSQQSETETVTLSALVAGSVVLWAFFIGIPALATAMKGRGIVDDLGLRFAWRDLVAFPAGAALQAIAVPVLFWPILQILGRTSGEVENEARKLTDSATGWGVLVLVLVVVVGAPLAEEIFFRGLVLRAAQKRWSLAVGLVASTLAFGLAHGQGIQLPALLLFGGVASMVVARTGRLGSAILLHSGFNAWTVFQLLVLS